MIKLLLIPYFLLVFVSSFAQVEQQKPNVIIIFTDDQGYEDVGVFGSKEIQTPHLDRMASEGVILTSFYAAQAVCSASRAALLTGCYPNRIGIHGALGPRSHRGLHPGEETIAELLKKEGYATAHFGKWHLGDHPDLLPTQQGFDQFFGIPYSNDMWPAHPWQGTVFNFPPLPLYRNDSIIRYITEDQSSMTTDLTRESVDFINSNADNPFFLYLAHPQPHVPLFVSDKFRGKSVRGLYGDVIMEIDWSVGQIMAALRENKIDSNTLVIFTSDNGPWLSYGDHAGSAGAFREGKGTAFEGGQREPFIAWFPGRLPEGISVDVPAMAIDLLPTISSITGADLPERKIDGKDIWPVLKGKQQTSPHEAFFYYYKTNELHAVRHGDWKLYFPHSYRTLNGRPGRNDGQPVDYDYIRLTEMELYNLKKDPSENSNVAGAYPEIVEKLELLANQMREKLGDSLTGITGNENRLPAQVNWKE